MKCLYTYPHTCKHAHTYTHQHLHTLPGTKNCASRLSVSHPVNSLPLKAIAQKYVVLFFFLFLEGHLNFGRFLKREQCDEVNLLLCLTPRNWNSYPFTQESPVHMSSLRLGLCARMLPEVQPPQLWASHGYQTSALMEHLSLTARSTEAGTRS